MEDDLVMNRLPYPKNYDGQEWNTIIKPSRKYIPKYLHEDLPQLKHIYIKEKFKEIGKFNCPKLEYFNSMIKNKKVPKPQTVTKSKSHNKSKRGLSYSEIKEQLQYALIIADKQSNIVDQLLEKAKNVQLQRSFKTNSHNEGSAIRKKNRRMSAARETGKFFNNTVELVFRNRKKEYLNSLKQQPETENTGEAEERIKSIKLMEFQN